MLFPTPVVTTNYVNPKVFYRRTSSNPIVYTPSHILTHLPPAHQVVLGSGGVGKSALTFRLITDSFVVGYDPTIEDDYRKQITIDGQVERLDILDTAGQEEYNSMRDMWYQSGEGFLLVYSITNRSTFEELDEVYKEILMAKDPVPEGNILATLGPMLLLLHL
jgi:GTPase SAR1 family protein